MTTVYEIQADTSSSIRSNSAGTVEGFGVVWRWMLETCESTRFTKVLVSVFEKGSDYALWLSLLFGLGFLGVHAKARRTTRLDDGFSKRRSRILGGLTRMNIIHVTLIVMTGSDVNEDICLDEHRESQFIQTCTSRKDPSLC